MMSKSKERKPTYAIETSVFSRKLKVSRRVGRLVNNFPYYALGQYIKYKAGWLGIRVVEISEAYTSQTCFNCHVRQKKSRKSQGLYKCKDCNEINANHAVKVHMQQ